ncbi:RDD family protein [Polaribacter sp. WD7]|mgnify:CR=1 FL=1|uniref:RDD family protein n=1 Tax=Polaribacter sp. WD7 TaxID=2269061 RepID=UPI000DF1EF1C|nr:RDD family protein [Polaribacter sp. WD7]RCS26949.1 RDD family protein [Polaribacter sp. WD7]
MKRLQIKTAQNVNINFTLANIGHRLLAFVIDNVIKFGYLYLAVELFNFRMFEGVSGLDNWSIRALDVILFLPITFYSLYTEILLEGQTLGKRILKIKVINEDGFKPTITDYTIRWFLRMVDFNLFILLYVYISSLGIKNQEVWFVVLFVFGKMIGFFLILFTHKNQRFGDLIANTVVINLKDDVKFSETILETISAKYIPTYPNVIRLSDNDVRIIKDTFTSAKKFNDYKTLIKLRSKIQDVTEIKSVHKSDTEFLDTVLKDYNYYTQDM